MKFQYKEALTPVHLMKPLWSRSQRDVRIWVNTMFILIFPKTENCEICKRTKITRAPCRRRKGEAVPRADNFGDLITADHKVLSDNCESRNNHRLRSRGAGFSYSMDPGVPVQKQNFTRKPKGACKSSCCPRGNQKSIYTDNSLEFGKACEDLSWHHCTSTPHRSETNGIAERAVRRVKEGTSAVLLQSGLHEKLVGRFYGMLYLSAKRHRFIVWWEDALWKTFWEAIWRTYYSFLVH